MNSRKRKWKNSSLGIVLFNTLLMIGVIAAFMLYKNDANSKMVAQNINDIVNINQSNANISTAFFQTEKSRILDISQYAMRHQMNMTELLQYIEQSVSSEEVSFELLGNDAKGFAAKRSQGQYVPVDYSNYSYKEMQKVLKEASKDCNTLKTSFMPEFTDYLTGRKVFALYCSVQVKGDDGNPKWYTLLDISHTATYENYINLDGQFDDFATVLIDLDGNYILGNQEYKSTNFYQYLYVYNNLNVDQQREIKKQMMEQQKGQLFYENSVNQPSVYAYTKVTGTDWYCIGCVPLESFHGMEENSLQYLAIMVLFLITLLLVDVGWLRKINNELRKSTIIAQKASMAKTDFLSQMSHDIRTPMNVINGMTNLALLETNKPEVEEYLKNIQSSSEFLTGLVNDILDLNKVESGKMELHNAPYSFEKFKRNIESIVLPQCQKKEIHFEMSCNQDQISIMTDSLRFNQIFLNLLSNAVKFTPVGGHISLLLNGESISKETLRLTCIVKDDGKGMSEEFQKHMFEAFSQEGPQQTGEVIGTGLGLAIVKNIVTLMNGTISVESALQKGTTFTITLDAQIAEYLPATQNDQINNIDEILKDKTVLLCEDHPLNQQIVIKLLERKGIHVEKAENGQQGVEMFAQSEPGHFAAILMDIRMPVMDGMEAAKAIRTLQREDAVNVPIIAMTANAYDIDVENSLKAGMNAHIPKPINPEVVYNTLAGFINTNKK